GAPTSVASRPSCPASSPPPAAPPTPTGAPAAAPSPAGPRAHALRRTPTWTSHRPHPPKK
ncbi:MAG: N-acetylmuramoyl-L-alanine amidase, partial [Acidimicrobiia bacterium]|nr:N-acetylmuramoyl-L-alanine amidase [Acidimicrobiia bacterium]